MDFLFFILHQRFGFVQKAQCGQLQSIGGTTSVFYESFEYRFILKKVILTKNVQNRKNDSNFLQELFECQYKRSSFSGASSKYFFSECEKDFSFCLKYFVWQPES